MTEILLERRTGGFIAPADDRAREFVEKLPVGTKFKADAKDPTRRKRSLDQNALYHVWVGLIAKETGHSHDEIHEWLKRQFLRPVAIIIKGKVHQVPRSTTRLNTREMADYMDAVYQFGVGELGLRLPVPEQEAA